MLALGLSSRRRTMDVLFPADLICEILKRIPAKELLKLKTVCKRWRFLISEPSFTDLQLRYSKQEDRIIFSLMYPSKATNRKSHVEHYSMAINMQENTSKLQEIQVLLKGNYSSSIRYSCNGMLLLHCLGGNILIIYNPITRVRKNLPSAPKKCDYRWALVQDASTRKYKVFGITVLDIECFVISQGETEWRYLHTLARTVERNKVLESELVCLENKLYWIARFWGNKDDEVKMRFIYSLDVADEEHITRNEIPFKLEFNDHCLSEVKGSLYITKSSFDQEGLETWVLKDAAKNLWIKCCSIRWSLFDNRPCVSTLSLVLPRDIEDSTSFLDQSRYFTSDEAGNLSMRDMKGTKLSEAATKRKQRCIKGKFCSYIDSLVNWQ